MSQTMTARPQTRTPALQIILAESEEDANVFAKLLKQHLDGILEGDPSKADVAAKIRGKLGLHSTEPEASVTLEFDAGRVTIRNGFEPGLDGTITGPLKLQTETLIGVANPYRAWLQRRLKIGIKWSRPLFTSQTYGFLTVPESMR